MTDTLTPEDIAAAYTAMGHSVDLIVAGKPEDTSDEDWASTLDRNASHLELMLEKDFWTTEDMSQVESAIAIARA